jgi:hypothetical protein
MTAPAPRRWYVGGSDALRMLVRNSLREFGVATYHKSEVSPGGELSQIHMNAPSFHRVSHPASNTALVERRGAKRDTSKPVTSLADLNALWPADANASPWVATPDGSWTRLVGVGVNPDMPPSKVGVVTRQRIGRPPGGCHQFARTIRGGPAALSA